MQHGAKNYARAFVDLGAKEAHVKKLIALMRRNGDASKMAKVVKEIERLLVSRSGGHLIEIQFARAQGAKLRELLLSRFRSKDRVVTKVSPGLIAGVRIVQDGEQEFDVSFAGKLNKLFA